MLSSRFSFFGGGEITKEPKVDVSARSGNSFESLEGVSKSQPTLRLITDKDVYRPGDSIVVTIEIVDPNDQGACTYASAIEKASACVIQQSLLIERLGFEFKGIEKLDTQWFVTQKIPSGSKEKRGEHLFMECSTSCLATNQILPCGSSKTYMVRTVLPDVIPPSYRGSAIRYLYYIKCSLYGRWLIMENGISRGELSKPLVDLEIRTPLQVWAIQNHNALPLDDTQNPGIVPVSPLQLDLYWKDMNEDSDWLQIMLNEKDDEEYESSRDEESSVSSYNPNKETVGSSASLQSYAPKYPNNESSNLEQLRRFSSLSLSRLSVTDSEGVSPYVKTRSEDSPKPERNQLSASEGFVRGKSYNIKVDNRVLLRFSPKNSDSSYYFSDSIGGTLTFFHDEGSRRCLEVSITLETSETINPLHVHPSRKNSPTITKVQSDHHEIVADLVQTSFLFSIPMDGPMSFSTSRVSVQWVLRFEFFITPKNVDWKRHEHPLLVNGRDRSEWTLPISVNAPPPAAVSFSKNEKPFAFEPL